MPLVRSLVKAHGNALQYFSPWSLKDEYSQICEGYGQEAQRREKTMPQAEFEAREFYRKQRRSKD